MRNLNEKMLLFGDFDCMWKTVDDFYEMSVFFLTIRDFYAVNLMLCTGLLKL